MDQIKEMIDRLFDVMCSPNLMQTASGILGILTIKAVATIKWLAKAGVALNIQRTESKASLFRLTCIFIIFCFSIHLNKVPSTITGVDLIHQIKTASWVWFTVNAALLLLAHTVIMNLTRSNERNSKEKTGLHLNVSKSLCVHTKHAGFLCQTYWKCWILVCVVFSSTSLIPLCVFLFIWTEHCRIGRYQLFQSNISKVLQTEILAGWQCKLASEIILFTSAFFSWGIEANWSENWQWKPSASSELFLSSCHHPEAYRPLFCSGVSSPDFTLDMFVCLHPHPSSYLHLFS